MDAGSIIATLKLRVDDFQRGMREAQGDLKSFSSGAKVALAAVGAAAGAGLGFLAKSAVEASAQMETLQATMETVMKGNKQAAKEYLDWAVEMAKKTPFEVDEVVEATVRLKSYGIEAKNTLGTVGDMAAAMGKPLMQAVEAVADAQTGELERLKEFGITKDMLIKKAAELGHAEAVNAKGQIVDQKAFNEALFALMEERFSGGMERQSKTFNGMMSNFKDNWAGFLRVVGEVLLPIGKKLLEEFLLPMTEKLKEIDPNKIRVPIETAVNILVGGFQLLGAAISGVVGFYKEHETTVKIVAGIITAALIPALTAFTAQLIILKVQALAGLLVSMGAWVAANTAVAASFVLVNAPILAIIAVIGLLVAAVVLIVRHWDEIKAKTEQVWSGIKEFLSGVFNAVKNAATVVFDALKAYFTAYLEFEKNLFLTVWNAIQTALTIVWNAIKSAATAVWEALKAFFTQWLTNVQGAFTNGWNAIKNLIQNVWNALKGVVQSAASAISSSFSSFISNIQSKASQGWNAIKNGFSSALSAVRSTFSSMYSSVMGSLNNLISGIKSKVMQAKQWLSELNPFKRHSPSLVDNVIAGVAAIKEQYRSVSELEVSAPSIGGLTPGRINVSGMFATEGAGASGGGSTTYNAPLVQVQNMEVRNDQDIRNISSELYNLQRHADRSRGR